MRDTNLYLVLGVVNIPVYWFIGKFLFTDGESFWEAIGYWFKPDLWSWINGDGLEDMMAEMKLVSCPLSF